MSKQKLTKNQKRRIQANATKALYRHKHSPCIEWNDDMLGEMQDGLVIARYASHADIEDTQGQIFRCNLRRTIPSLVVGDRVIWRQGNKQLQGISGVVEGIYPRQNILTRPDYYDGLKPIASNIHRIIIVSAVLPSLSLNIIDRYLVICENAQIPALILLNKIDLLDEKTHKAISEQLQIYKNIGYDVLMVSANTGENIQALLRFIQQGNNIFVGQSGVGKSSLINHIFPEKSVHTQEVSVISGLGQHTTTTSRLYHLPQGGNLIDSPGIREFGLWHLTENQIMAGYREFHPFLGKCKFRDCQHDNDPHCAIQKAVNSGEIHPERFKNYHRLRASLNETKSQRHFTSDPESKKHR